MASRRTVVWIDEELESLRIDERLEEERERRDRLEQLGIDPDDPSLSDEEKSEIADLF